MAIIKSFSNYYPKYSEDSFIAENATLVGNVVLENGVSVWYGAVIRADVNHIRIGTNTNIQDNVMVHGSTGRGDTLIGNNCTIGHNAVIHGCKIGNNVLVGMNATILDDAIIEDNAMVAAGAVVLENSHIKSGELWAGVPAKMVKQIDINRINNLTEQSAKKYVLLSLKHKHTTMEEQVVLVDNQDNVLGYMGKQEAHEKGVLHRAISIIITNSNNEILLQQRADCKYHWAGIWSNSVCSHPRKNESYQQAAERRLFEELGFNAPLTEAFDFIYKAKDEESGLTEHELDHVFLGKYEGEIPFNPNEVKAVKWVKPSDLLADVKQNPDKYSFWFKIILKEMQTRSML